MTARRVILALIVIVALLLCLSIALLLFLQIRQQPAQPALPAATPTAVTGEFTITFIDVGQGDSALLRDPNGFTVLMDGGVRSAGPIIAEYLRDEGVRQIDVLVASHPDSDHIGGLITVLEMDDIPVRKVLYNGYPGDTRTWEDFARAVRDEGLRLTVTRAGDRHTWGQMRAVVINPQAGLNNPESNSACLAVMVTTGQLRTLFTCDLAFDQERDLINRGVDLDADILKVAHHGSGEGSSTAFLEAVSPEIAVISVGADNTYGHPREETLARLEDAGAGIWRTDLDGHIVIRTDGIRYAINEPLPAAEGQTPVTGSDPAGAAEPTPLPTARPERLYRVVITTVFYDGELTNEPDEYVEILNEGSQTVQLGGWTLRDKQNHVFTFPDYSLPAGEMVRVYTNQVHPDTGGFSYNTTTPVWNNGGDCAELRDPSGALVAEYCY